jgi:hypothetical protein
MKRNDEGQSIIELAIMLPFMAYFVMTVLQLALVAFTYIGVTTATREGIRWVAIHPDTTDAAATATIKAGLPPTLNQAKVTVVVTPACTVLDPLSGKCPNRLPGSQLSVTLSYDASSLVLFPGVYAPALSPTYTMYMRAEPD